MYKLNEKEMIAGKKVLEMIYGDGEVTEEDVLEDCANHYLTFNEGIDKKEYCWYLDENKSVCVCVETLEEVYGEQKVLGWLADEKEMIAAKKILEMVGIEPTEENALEYYGNYEGGQNKYILFYKNSDGKKYCEFLDGEVKARVCVETLEEIRAGQLG